MDKEVFKKALDHFKKSDLAFYKGLKGLPLPLERVKVKRGESPYEVLVGSIISQQISTKAAASIHKRFLELFPNKKIDFSLIVKMTEADFKGVGISTNKSKYILDLAQKMVSGQLPRPQILKKMSDEEVIEALTQIKGIGVWTAQMLLIFHLQRKNIFPSGDLGVQRGYQYLFKKRDLPKPKDMEKRAQKWSPYNSIAALMLWERKHVEDEKKH